jgi:anti-sigma factor RsiW
MKEQLCDQYLEWMSLAQDGMLSSTQTHLLHAHLASCPECQTTWQAMTAVSQILHAAPMVAPTSGFVGRVQARLAVREDRRRQVIVGALLGIGVLSLTALALPSIVGLLSITGRLVLPYIVIAYAQGVCSWAASVLGSLASTIWVLARHLAAQPSVWTCTGFAAAAAFCMLVWIRVWLGRMTKQESR